MIINWKEAVSRDNGNNFYNGGWVKMVTGVDTTKSNGYAFEGEFISRADKGLTECTDGLYIVCSIEGSRKNQRKEVAVFRITGEAVEKVIDWVHGNDWSLKIRGQVAELLEQKPESPLTKVTDEDLIAELKKRGYEVNKVASEVK